MAPSKHGETAYGHWTRDENNLPCYCLAPARVPPLFPPLRHHLGTGRLQALADHWGRVQFLAESGAGVVCLNALAARSLSALHVEVLPVGGVPASLLLAELPDLGEATVCWGIGYLRYEGTAGPGPAAIRFAIELVAVPDQTFFLVRLRLTARSQEPLTATVRVGTDVEVTPALPTQGRPAMFRKDGITAQVEAHPQLGDVFLAGPESWKPGGTPRLTLEREIRLAPDETTDVTFLLGCDANCSVERVRRLLAAHSTTAARAAWAERTAGFRLRAPELWMQEECTWAGGQLLAFCCQPRDAERKLLHPGGQSLFGPALGASCPARAAPVRDLLTLALSQIETEPPLALANLVAATCCQRQSGRLPEELGGQTDDTVRSLAARSDLEIWLLLAWAEYAARHEQTDPLQVSQPFADGGSAPVWEHLRQACQWVRNEVRTGPHGLVRILAGDWLGFLNRMGSEGKGESVLNTGLLCQALRRLAELAHRRSDSGFATQLVDWQRTLSEAVTAAFDGKWFLYGYTDAGQPVGGAADGRLFLPVQAWAVIARCGTASQRDSALRSALACKVADQPLPALSKPYPPPLPLELSDQARFSGEAENGGVSLAAAAWFIWALVREGHRDLALREWECLASRRRTTQPGAPPLELAGSLGWFTATTAGARAGLASLRELDGTASFPSAHGVAWLPFAMKHILTGA